MSEWGFVTADTAERHFKNKPVAAGEMVEEMSRLILTQEKEIDGLKTEILGLQVKSMNDLTAVERLLGWQDRVREVEAVKFGLEAPREKP